jgi:5,10-methylenetetrahydrofolate reductase
MKVSKLFYSVEWSPRANAASLQGKILKEVNNCQLVFPDLPNVFTQDDRVEYLFQVPPSRRIMTVSTCRHTPETLAASKFKADKLLLVGGNEKQKSSLSTVDAAKILKETSKDMTIWGTTNPNDPKSIDSVSQKIEAGITGFVTQPLLSFNSLDIFESYPRTQNEASDISFVAGMAMPRSAKNLQFWCKLLEQPELEDDPLFKAHLAFFSQPYFTSIAWLGKELENLYTRATIDGIHFIPMENTEDMRTILRHLEE